MPSPAASAAPAEGTTGQVAFEVRNVAKHYPGVQALKSVSLSGYAGEVLAICGANGAGKSTLAKLLAGMETPTAGSIEVTGHDGPLRSPSDAVDAGILLIHQEPVIVDDFTVAENVLLQSFSTAGSRRGWDYVSEPKQRETSRTALRAVGLDHLDPATSCKDLGPGIRQMIAMSRTQVVRHKILLLDESTASATEEYFENIRALVKRECAEGVSVIFVSHRMPEVFSIADRIAVLRDGRLMGVKRTSETTPSEIISMMIGKAMNVANRAAGPAADAPTALEVSGLSSGSATDIGFRVKAGEVLGLYGLIGSGRSSIVRSISGHQSRTAGRVTVGGREVQVANPRQGSHEGIAYLTEHRVREGYIQDFTNAENLTLSAMKKFSRFGVILRGKQRKRVDELMRAFEIKGTPRTLTRTLSGGNVQKVCIGKWMETEPEVVLLDEPTKGIDIGARQRIYESIAGTAAAGKAVVVVTSEAEEALMVCNRILVVKDGRIAAELAPETATTDDLIRVSLEGAAT
ncbi:sugar ABC transporter ATP-binding protein [Streptomyces sp. MMS24-I2-30]|uniref:sugar ABC transporter ATP-binding protein n=1 Tax=Streptomyces sp. MMS24-I2-30 TaxID=3351564 RepID=UPI003896D899